MTPRYLVLADERSEFSTAGLVGACVGARTSALARPGVSFTVERTDSDDVLAAYRSEHGVLVRTWVR